MYGTIVKEGVPQSGVTVTIKSGLGSDIRVTDADGHYIYDDLTELPYAPGGTISVSVPGASNSFIAASEPEEKEINLFYTSIASGSITLSGTTTGLLATRTLSVSSGSLTLSGTAVGLLATRKLPVASGSITLAGTVVGLITIRKLPITSGSIILAGSEVGLMRFIRFFVDIACVSGATISLQSNKGTNIKVEAVRG